MFTVQRLFRPDQGPSANPTYLPIGASIPCHLRVGVYQDTAYTGGVVHIDNVQVFG